MTAAEFRAALLAEQFGQPVPEWQPTSGHRAASARRVELVGDALRDQQTRTAS